MKEKSSLILDDDFITYCKLNNIEDIDKLAKETFRNGFNLLKYGNSPSIDPSKVIIREPLMLNEGKSTPEPRKDNFTDIKKGNGTIVPSTLKPLVEQSKKELYDE